MKLEDNKKKILRKENNHINLETNFVDVPFYLESKSQNIRGIKNKMLIIKSENEPIGSFKNNQENFIEKSNKSLKNNGGGTLYKTHTFRQKFSNPHFIFEQLSLNYKLSDEKISLNDNDLLKSTKFTAEGKKIKKAEEKNSYEMNLNPNNSNNFVNLSNFEEKEKMRNSVDNSPEKEKNQKNTIQFSNSKANPKYYSPSNSNFVDIKKFSNNPFTTASTIYTLLTKRKNDFIQNIKNNKNLADPSKFKENDLHFIQNISNEKNQNVKNRKKSFMKRNPMTYYMDKKVIEDIPHVYPIVWIHQNDYENISEKNRYEKITQMFLKLRYYIENDEENEKNYLKEFMMKHGIYEDKFYTIDKLNNFMNFLKSESISKLNPNKIIKDIIIDATNFGNSDDNEDNEENQENVTKNYNQNKSLKNKKIFRKFSQTHHDENFKSNSYSNMKKDFEIDHDRFNMASYLSHHQPILDEKKFKIKNESAMIDKLEKEMERLRQGEGGLNFNLNESNSTNLKNFSKHDSSNKKISEDYKNGNLKIERKKTNPSRRENEENNQLVSVKLPLVKNEIDIDLVKKKKKLLEFIVLNRTKSRVVWKNQNENVTQI